MDKLDGIPALLGFKDGLWDCEFGAFRRKTVSQKMGGLPFSQGPYA